MTTPAIIQSRVVQPGTMAGPAHSAAYGLAQVLKTLITHSPGLHTEDAVHQALADVDAWVKSLVPASAMPALATGDQRAPHEDVTQRTPPGGAPAPAYAGPPIDYNRLAAAILAAQQAQQNAQLEQ